MASVSVWAGRLWQDLQPTPGRLNSSLRIVLASVITLICLLVTQAPFASVALYFVFLVGRDSPSLSLRTGFLSILTLVIAVATELAVVILTDNDPMARVLSVSIVTFLAGVLVLSTTLATLPTTWGFIFCTLIALWENHAPSDALVKNSLWLVGAGGIAVGSAVAVEYIFATRKPAEKLQEQRIIRYRALDAMFSAFAEGASPDALREAAIPLARLAAAGDAGMQALYNSLVDRNLDTANLPVATRVRITMLAQLMDVAAAFGASNLKGVDDPVLRQRCRKLATLCHDLSLGIIPAASSVPPAATMPNPTLLDRAEGILNLIISMPDDEAARRRKELIALPASRVPVVIPGAFTDKATVAFALKLSLCATACYIFYNAVAWPGISTSVTTVFIAGLSTTGAIKQRLIFRLLGAIIGGFVLGLGATAFLFPHMDSISSLTILVACVAFLSAWWAGGRQFNYIGLQIAFSFYLVAFEGSSAPTSLAPPRDRLIGILVALVVMAIVFDLMWPVRTITAMRRSLASVFHAVADLLRLVNAGGDQKALLRKADGLRDRTGKTIAGLRALEDVVAYDFGIDRETQILAGQTMLRAAFDAAGIFWNHFSFLHTEEDADFLIDGGLRRLRLELCTQMDAMADAVEKDHSFQSTSPAALVDECILDSPRFGEYVRNTVEKYTDLERIVHNLESLRGARR